MRDRGSANEKKGLRICGGRGEVLMTGVSANSSSCIDCEGNCLAGHSTMTLQLILFVSYYLSSAKFVKLKL